MTSFELLSEDDQLLYAHALERKGRELVELILRKRRVTQELAPILPPGEQEAVLAKIHAGMGDRILKAQAEAVILESAPREDPDKVAP